MENNLIHQALTTEPILTFQCLFKAVRAHLSPQFEKGFKGRNTTLSTF